MEARIRMGFKFKRKDELENLSEKIQEHLPVFAKNRLEEFQKLEKSVEASDFEAIRDYCHKQIGVAACYNCFQLEELSLYIQGFAREDKIHEIREVMPTFRDYIQSLILRSK